MGFPECTGVGGEVGPADGPLDGIDEASAVGNSDGALDGALEANGVGAAD